MVMVVCGFTVVIMVMVVCGYMVLQQCLNCYVVIWSCSRYNGYSVKLLYSYTADIVVTWLCGFTAGVMFMVLCG